MCSSRHKVQINKCANHSDIKNPINCAKSHIKCKVMCDIHASITSQKSATVISESKKTTKKVQNTNKHVYQ